jgi:geranylgeranyl pyrophosphate synthase
MAILLTPSTRIRQMFDVLTPYRYLACKPGKSIRTKFIKAFRHWIPLNDLQMELVVQVVEMLHTASLLYMIFNKNR